MGPLSHKKDRWISKSGFALNNQSVTLNFELSCNERTLDAHWMSMQIEEVFLKFNNFFIFIDFELRNKTLKKVKSQTRKRNINERDNVFKKALPENRTYDMYKEDVALVHIYFESPTIVVYKKQRTMTE